MVALKNNRLKVGSKSMSCELELVRSGMAELGSVINGPDHTIVDLSGMLPLG